MTIIIEPENICVCCGRYIPDGRQVCKQCMMNMDASTKIPSDASTHLKKHVKITAEKSSTEEV